MSDPLQYWSLCIGLSALLILWIFLLPAKARAASSLALRPNWLSVAGAVVALVGYFYFFKNEEYFWAVIILSLSGGLDLADGRIARAYVDCGGKHLTKDEADFWVRMNHRGTTDLGASLDPGMDKLRLAPIFIDVCLDFFAKAEDVRFDGLLWLLYLGIVLIGLMLLVDLVGQALRSRIFRRWRRRPKKRRDKNKATWKGKAKALAQWLWIPVWVVWTKELLPEAATYLALLDILLVGVLVLTIASVLSKMRSLKKLWKKGFPLELE